MAATCLSASLFTAIKERVITYTTVCGLLGRLLSFQTIYAIPCHTARNLYENARLSDMFARFFFFLLFFFFSIYIPALPNESTAETHFSTPD